MRIGSLEVMRQRRYECQSWAAYSRSQQSRKRLQRWREAVGEIEGQHKNIMDEERHP